MKMPFKTLAKLLIQASDAYCNGGPDYMRLRMIDLIRQLREWCDDVESLLTDGEARKAESERNTGELEAIL